MHHLVWEELSYNLPEYVCFSGLLVDISVFCVCVWIQNMQMKEHPYHRTRLCWSAEFPFLGNCQRRSSCPPRNVPSSIFSSHYHSLFGKRGLEPESTGSNINIFFLDNVFLQSEQFDFTMKPTEQFSLFPYCCFLFIKLLPVKADCFLWVLCPNTV
jgi:hypothetical protein